MSTSHVIDVEASRECELNGEAFALHARRGVIVINVKTAKTARALIGQLCRVGKTRSTAARLNAALMNVSHRLEVHVDGVIVASMGQGTNSGLLRFAGLRQLRIWPLRLLRRSPSG